MKCWTNGITIPPKNFSARNGNCGCISNNIYCYFHPAYLVGLGQIRDFMRSHSISNNITRLKSGFNLIWFFWINSLLSSAQPTGRMGALTRSNHGLNKKRWAHAFSAVNSSSRARERKTFNISKGMGFLAITTGFFQAYQQDWFFVTFFEVLFWR